MPTHLIGLTNTTKLKAFYSLDPRGFQQYFLIFEDALGDHPLTELHFYPDRDHAFARKGGAHYDEGDVQTANARTAEFFDANLV